MKLTGKASGIGVEGVSYTPPEGKPQDGNPRAPRTWVVVADSRVANIYQRVPAGLELIATATPDENEKEKPPREKRRERSFASSTGIHFASNPKDRTQRFSFIKEVTAWLERARAEKAFDRLVLVAGPAVLGEFHAALPESLHELIYQELAKGLTHAPVATLQEYL